jgi:tight adherence protein B
VRDRVLRRVVEPGPRPRWLPSAPRGLVAIDRADRRRRAYRRALPSVLEEIARSLRSGASVPGALAEVAGSSDDPVRAELRRVVERLDGGEDLASALRWWRGHAADASVALPAAALALASESGGSRAWAVDQVAATFRERRALEDELRAQASQAHLSAVVLVVAPLVFAVLGAAVDPTVLAFLVLTPAGWACLLAGLLLDAAGAWWMARLTRSPW